MNKEDIISGNMNMKYQHASQIIEYSNIADGPNQIKKWSRYSWQIHYCISLSNNRSSNITQSCSTRTAPNGTQTFCYYDDRIFSLQTQHSKKIYKKLFVPYLLQEDSEKLFSKAQNVHLNTIQILLP